MTIRREQLASTDFSEVSGRGRLAAIHPGEVLNEDFIKPLSLTRYRVAKAMGISQRRIDLICRGDSAVSAEMALRLARLFGTTPELWINLQAQYDLEQAAQDAGQRIQDTITPLVFKTAPIITAPRKH